MEQTYSRHSSSAGATSFGADKNEVNPCFVIEVVPAGDRMFFLDPNYSQGVRDTKIDDRWREEAIKWDYLGAAHELLQLPERYELSLQAAECRVTQCLEGNVAIYSHYIDFGLRFPLDPTLVKILQGWNICLAQLHPLAIRTVISYIWVCRWMGFPESLSLFKWLHVLKKSSSATDAG